MMVYRLVCLRCMGSGAECNVCNNKGYTKIAEDTMASLSSFVTFIALQDGLISIDPIRTSERLTESLARYVQNLRSK